MNKVIKLTEKDLEKIIEKVITEETATAFKGYQPLTSVHKDTNKESNDYHKSLAEKMKKAVKVESDGIDKKDAVKVNADEGLGEEKKDVIQDYNYGLANLKYDTEPSKRFKERAEKAIIGDSTMGNGETEQTEMNDDVKDKDLGKKIIAAAKARAEAEAKSPYNKIISLGDDIEAVKEAPGKDRKLAFESIVKHIKQKLVKEGIKLSDSDIQKSIKEEIAGFGSGFQQDEPEEEPVDVEPEGEEFEPEGEEFEAEDDIDALAARTIASVHQLATAAGADLSTTVGTGEEEGEEYEDEELVDVEPEGEELEPEEFNESKKYKRLKFSTEFKSADQALTLIPEHHKVDGNLFQLTDSNNYITVRWEGDKETGEGVVLLHKNVASVNESMNRMKSLMGYKFGDTINERRTITGGKNKTIVEQTRNGFATPEDEPAAEPAEPELEDIPVSIPLDKAPIVRPLPEPDQENTLLAGDKDGKGVNRRYKVQVWKTPGGNKYVQVIDDQEGFKVGMVRNSQQMYIYTDRKDRPASAGNLAKFDNAVAGHKQASPEEIQQYLNNIGFSDENANSIITLTGIV